MRRNDTPLFTSPQVSHRLAYMGLAFNFSRYNNANIHFIGHVSRFLSDACR